MSKTAISIHNISKSYNIHHQLQRNAHPTLRDDLARLARKPLQLIGAAGGTEMEKFWALKDISFDVKQGEVVGIMGRNGSGKSTLFKILSRVTQPTAGHAEIRGQSASLLEVGTGFHPELTGRENVYFNGSILGMKKRQIDQRFDEIVAFAEVEKFLDTPVKFYSSGMKVRLAFSVAAFLDPEILIIDEVLAVGDVKFKEKSLNRMKSIADNEGKTILFVSHIISQIEAICNRGIVLDNGQVILDGPVDQAVRKYLDLNVTNNDDIASKPDEQQYGIDISDVEIGVNYENQFPSLEVNYALKNPQGLVLNEAWPGLMIVNDRGVNISYIDFQDIGSSLKLKDKHNTYVKIVINNLNLRPGKYFVRLYLRDGRTDSMLRRIDNAGFFELKEYKSGDIYISNPKEPTPSVLFIDADIHTT